MTQDQYGQAKGPGYVVRGDVVPDDEAEGYPTGEDKPMTRFQKVASALRGDRADRDGTDQDQAGRDEADQGQPAASRTQDPDAPGANPPWVTEQDEAAMANSPISREAPDTTGAPQRDYWDVPGATGTERAEAVAVASPDVPVTPAGRDAADHPATEPDMFGTTAHPGNGATSAPYAEGPAGAATIADVPAGDLTYGNLIPDAGHYTAQWQQVQFKFVDDPRASVTKAADIIAQVTAKMEAAIQERQRAIEERQRAIAEQQRTLRGRWGEARTPTPRRCARRCGCTRPSSTSSSAPGLPDAGRAGQPQRTRTPDFQDARRPAFPATVTPARPASRRFHRNR
jgi:hypothetical protein